MKNSKIITIAVILLIVAALVIFMSIAVSDATSSAKNKNHEEQVNQMIDTVNSFDYTIYWVGVPPQYLTEALGDNISVLSLKDVTAKTMPVSTSFADFKVYDAEGNLVREVEAADYSDNMLIVVGNDVTIDAVHLDIIRQAVVGNHVPCLFMGSTNIQAFRDMMLLTRRSYSEGDTMLYDKLGMTRDNPLSADDVESWMTFLLEIFDAPAPTPVIVSTEQPILIDETALESVDETELEEITEESIIEILGTIETTETEVETVLITEESNGN